MRARASVAGLVGCLFLVGCSGGGWRDGLPFQPSPDLAKVEKIEISAEFWCAQEAVSSYTWVLCKGGPCRGTINHRKNAGPGGPADEQGEYELPPETFEECRALLQETNFLTMRSSVVADVPLELQPVSSRVSAEPKRDFAPLYPPPLPAIPPIIPPAGNLMYAPKPLLFWL